MRKGAFLLRQVFPDFLIGRTVKSPVFNPHSIDHAISVDNADLIAIEASYKNNFNTEIELTDFEVMDVIKAKKSYESYIANTGKQSAGVFALTVEECKSAGLKIESDPIQSNPAHSIILFPNTLNKHEIRDIKSKLTFLANTRGPLFLAPGVE